MNIQTAFFDFDGTLFDSMYVWETIGVKYLESKGCIVNENIHEHIKKFTLLEAAAYFQKEYNIPLTPKEICLEINKLIQRSYLEEIQPKPHARELLDKLNAMGTNLYIATVTDKHLIDGALKRVGLRDYFIDIFSAADFCCSKNSLEFFDKLSDNVTFDKQTTWLFDDAAHACATAKEYGINVCGIQERTELEQDKVKANSNLYIADFSEFIELL